MRLERRGNPPNLQGEFKRLVIKRLKGRSLDDNHAEESAKGRFPDFSCFNGLVLIEMKNLEKDQGERVNEVFQAKVNPAEKPLFFGRRDGQLVIDNVSNGEEIKAAIVSKLSRTIEGLLRSANEQFASYRFRHPRKNCVSICVILNSSLREYTPEMVNHAIHRNMKRSGSDEPRFPSIDAVLYFTEKHYKMLADGRVAFATTIYIGFGAATEYWKEEIVDRIVNEWSGMRTGGAPVPADDPYNFDLVHDIPGTMSRSESWYLEYRRDPYLQNVPLERLKVMFNRCVALSAIGFMQGDWPKPSSDQVQEQMRRFTHLIEETNRRGVDMREFAREKLTPIQQDEVYSGLPPALIELLRPKS